jgi:hypothetical protein
VQARQKPITGFSVFTSRILATELSQSHYNFNSHMKSSYHSLIPFLLLFCWCQFRRLDSIQYLLDCCTSRLLFCTPTTPSLLLLSCRTLLITLPNNGGRAIAEAVSRWLPTAVARVQSRVLSSGICGGLSGVGAGFLRVLRFPLPFIPPNSPSSQSPGGRYNRPASGRRAEWIQFGLHPPLCKLN